MQEALGHGNTPPSDEVLSVEGPDDDKLPDKPVEKVETEKVEAKPDEKKVDEKKVDEKPLEKKVEAKADEKPEEGEELGKRAQKRISRLVAEREEANRRAEAAEAKAKSLEEAQQKPAEKKVETVASDAEWLKTNPEPQQEDFPDYDAFSRKWTTWEIERQRDITVRKAEAAGEAAAQKILDAKAAKDAAEKDEADRTEQFQHFEETKEDARGRYDDFDDVIASAKDLPLSGEMQFIIMDSAVGHDIAYWLAQHPDEAEELSALKGAAAVRELGRLERTIEIQVAGAGKGAASDALGVGVEEKPVVPAKKVAASKAPAPIAPVGGRGVATSVRLEDPNLDYQSYKTLRNKQEVDRRRRR